MHSVGCRIIILCQFGRQVAMCTEANSGQKGPHVGTDPVSVRYPRQFGLPTAKYISVYEFGSANRRDSDSKSPLGVFPYMRAERPSWRGQSPKWNGTINRSPEQENILKQPRWSSANKKLNGLGLATTLQTRNQTVRALQHRCKQETKRFGPCNIVANKKLNGLGLATALQTRNQMV